jgi:hypothetical protein
MLFTIIYERFLWFHNKTKQNRHPYARTLAVPDYARKAAIMKPSLRTAAQAAWQSLSLLPKGTIWPDLCEWAGRYEKVG